MDSRIRKLAEQHAAACKEEAEALLRALGQIPAPSRQEGLRAAFVRSWLLEQGAEDVIIDDAKNVLFGIGCAEHTDIVVFAAHTDVVFPDTGTLPMREENGRLYAPGIGDDTANLVHLLMGAKYLLKNRLPTTCGILFAANSCEEGLGNLDGVREIFTKYGSRIREFYSFDCYMPCCCGSAVGSHRYRVTCKTRGGHSFADFGQPNAIEILCGLVERLYRIPLPEDGRTTFNVGRIEGGTTVNAIAQECSMLYEFRSTSQASLMTMDAAFQEALESLRASDISLTAELLGVRPGNGFLNEAVQQELTRRTAEIIHQFCPEPINFAPSSTDSNIPLSLGIPANTVGTIRGGGAHTREEWVDLDSMVPGQAIALSLMLQYVVLS